jgi:hypothetical protein
MELWLRDCFGELVVENHPARQVPPDRAIILPEVMRHYGTTTALI